MSSISVVGFRGTSKRFVGRSLGYSNSEENAIAKHRQTSCTNRLLQGSIVGPIPKTRLSVEILVGLKKPPKRLKVTYSALRGNGRVPHSSRVPPNSRVPF